MRDFFELPSNRGDLLLLINKLAEKEGDIIMEIIQTLIKMIL